jgi:NDP-sugar pyrophosphorylase family protein
MNKKYELTDEVIERAGHKLYRIKAVRSFSNVKKGDLGGWIEKEGNLSYNSDCWIYDNAMVFDKAMASDNAKISGNAQVCGDAWVYDNASVCDNAQVSGKALVSGVTCVYDNAWISGYIQVNSKSKISGNCILQFNNYTYLEDITLDYGIWINSCIIDNKKYIISNTLEKLYIKDVK